ncbi:MAG: ribosomal-processing cysteine protease Prp [Clostridia bacterium]|nr:ribosomal-processing cysteine protease Prp [Clostridia bacterium]
MICATFLKRNGVLCGFSVQGHSGSAPSGQDIVCAAVSSAVYMAANTVTDVCGCTADIREEDGQFTLTVTKGEADAQAILQGLTLHLKGLAQQYPNFIKILTEV